MRNDDVQFWRERAIEKTFFAGQALQLLAGKFPNGESM
jgi:hypothetical protein